LLEKYYYFNAFQGTQGTYGSPNPSLFWACKELNHFVILMKGGVRGTVGSLKYIAIYK
jgi:hypothetical protein